MYQDIIAPSLLSAKVDGCVTEVAEQIYQFQLFTPEFCAQLIDKLKVSGEWMLEDGLDAYAPINIPPDRREGAPGFGKHLYKYLEKYYGVEFPHTPDKTNNALPLAHIEGMNELFLQLTEEHLKPIIETRWPLYPFHVVAQPYALKYEATDQAHMDLHYDIETVSMIVYLNDDFEGGGTWFPRWDYFTGNPRPGTALLFPGWASHPHSGRPVTSGTRYLLHGAFF